MGIPHAITFNRREQLLFVICSGAQILAVALVAASQPTSGTPATIAALALAPLAVAGVAASASRLGGSRFAVAAAALYVLLPFLGNRFELAPARTDFDHRALPALLGLQ